MEMTIFDIGGEDLSIHEAAAISIVGECEEQTYQLKENSPSWLAIALDMLVLEGIMEVVKSGEIWKFSEYGEEMWEDPDFLSDLNIFTEVARMSPGFYN